ncbi:sigma-54-dependent transcriptional regulator [Roseibacillus ishigakijimensis]|uniref:Sigma-54-dependent Fis family transcriptional regulator n=1 Tax=Roseibacillus ishigakijimensis TaxID=454146 RepID=A0A934VLC3_9BACT|nr:sigma-54 dependent transcriptional regulator [Roseibacillus ishigakijimensis]MBK1833087.1 sigma-54-dependent Fis family transcriptional regulator [Roseibacillus ishigakijimensis]
MDILIVDDEKSIRTTTSIAVEAEGHYAETADSARIAEMKLKEADFNLVFLDLRLGEDNGMEVLRGIVKHRPDLPVVIFTAHASIETAVEATREGAFDYLEKPFTPDQLRAILLKAEKASRTQKKITNLETEVKELQTQVSTQAPPSTFESKEPAMQESLSTLFRAAATPASILILGESGTGKSVISKAIHEQSHLAGNPFVTVSCPSLSKELLESELFGHVKGSFTGAVKDKWGKVAAADGGTLFLDEIGELPLEIQPKLLRLLQEKEYERLGETKTRQSNVRIIAATNRNLAEMVAAGEFREDLFYRLNVISVELPPLRERPRDLQVFAHNYLAFFGKQVGREGLAFSSEALMALKSYPWPGNLRELRNSIERAAILAQGNEIEARDLPSAQELPLTTGSASEKGPGGVSSLCGSNITLAELEEEHIKQVLARSESLQQAAEILGIDNATLYRKRKKLNLG